MGRTVTELAGMSIHEPDDGDRMDALCKLNDECQARCGKFATQNGLGLMICRYCRSDEVVRSRMRLRDVILLPLLLLPFRCLSCHRRFYRPIWSRPRGVYGTRAKRTAGEGKAEGS
jgi:hypothetical protein